MAPYPQMVVTNGIKKMFRYQRSKSHYDGGGRRRDAANHKATDAEGAYKDILGRTYKTEVRDLDGAPHPEQIARDNIDMRLAVCGWVVQRKNEINLAANDGVAVRECQTDVGPADYLLFVEK